MSGLTEKQIKKKYKAGKMSFAEQDATLARLRAFDFGAESKLPLQAHVEVEPGRWVGFPIRK